jgi:hypothetical protein
MRYLNHHFAHFETLDRARRWLVHAGFDPSQIEVMTDGIPRIAVRVEGGQAAEAGMIINAVELTDPQGFPSFWELATQEHIHNPTIVGEHKGMPDIEPRSFLVGYHRDQEGLESVAGMTAEEIRQAYVGQRGS